MAEIVIDIQQKKALQHEFIEALKAANLVILPEDAAAFAHDFYKEQKKLLAQKALTPYQIAKYKLLPGVKTLKTVKDMINDGRITGSEYYNDTNGKLKISCVAIKRLRNE